MTRLMDRLFASRAYMHHGDKISELLLDAECLSCDNVAQYIDSFAQDKSAFDYPNIAPPFHNFFVEYKVPSSKTGDMIGAHILSLDWNKLICDMPNELANETNYMLSEEFGALPDSRWQLVIFPYWLRTGILSTGVKSMVWVNVDGQLSSRDEDSISLIYLEKQEVLDKLNRIETDEHTEAYIKTILHPIFLAISFLHCKNVTMERETPPAPLSKKYQKKHGRPLVSYHTLNIEPMKQILRAEGNIEKTGLKQALHICRGHFKDFSKGSGLFGKYKGLYWWDSQVRGSVKEGIVDKDYAVKSPKELRQ